MAEKNCLSSFPEELGVSETRSCSEVLHSECDDDKDVDRLECAVCLQACIHPVQLPCGHIFCYLCVKGVANQSKRCAMCRKELPSGYLEHPNLLNVGELEGAFGRAAFDDGRQWFYEGHNGWWQYDQRTSLELETAFVRGDHFCELLIAGFLYVIDFNGMVQFRRNDPSRRRHIKRDMATIPKKGIAGLRLQDADEEVCDPDAAPSDVAVDDEVEPFPVPRTLVTEHRGRRASRLPRRQRDSDGAEGVEENDATATTSTSNVFPQSGLPPSLPRSSQMSVARSLRSKSISPVPTAPSNTPQTPHTPSQDSGTSSPTAVCDSSLHEIVQGMENLLGAIHSGDSESDAYEDSTDDDLHPHAPLAATGESTLREIVHGLENLRFSSSDYNNPESDSSE